MRTGLLQSVCRLLLVTYLRPVLGLPLLLLLEVLGLSSFISDWRMLSSVYARQTRDRSTSNGCKQKDKRRKGSIMVDYKETKNIYICHRTKTTFYNSHPFLFYLEQGFVFSCCFQCRPHISERHQSKTEPIQNETFIYS